MMITDIEDYFAKGCGRCDRFDTASCSTKRWRKGLAELRAICLSAGLEETVKWGHPCYMHAGRNIVLIGAFIGDFRLSFFNAALLRDPEGVLEKAGPNTRQAGTIRFTSEHKVAELAGTIGTYIEEAKEYADAGLKPPKDDSLPELPDELAEALDADPGLAEAFHALTPGRQRSYVIRLADAKKPETRVRRIEGFRARIMAGKGATER